MSETQDEKETPDALDSAFTALREGVNGESDSATDTRRAILVAATNKRRRKLIIARVVFPIAAVFAISTAWAAATGRLPRRLTELFAPERNPHFVPVPVTTRELPPPPVATTVTSIEKPAIEDTPFTAPPIVPSAGASSTSKPSSLGGTPSEPPSVAAIDPEERLYRAAHQAHFVDRDWSAALAAWDVYIVAHPKGRFAPEARYNRALALVRLGRRDEAKTALAPFADGTFGGYRQREARELLDAMP